MTIGLLVAWTWINGGVYRSWCLDALESSFVLNLIILVAATYHVKHSGGSQLAVEYTSVLIAFAIFIGILAYHIFQQLRQTKLWKKVPKLSLEFIRANIVKQPVNNPVRERTDSRRFRESLLEDL